MSGDTAGRMYIGLMSGTSLDGADAALVDFSTGFPRTLAFATVAFSDALRERILALSEPGRDSLDLSATVSIELAELYSRAVESVIAGGGVREASITAIGCHGQTVRHRPEAGFTIQVNDPARLAELTGIDVVADFRRRDIAAGGQGAPLVPAFHEVGVSPPRTLARRGQHRRHQQRHLASGVWAHARLRLRAGKRLAGWMGAQAHR